MASVQARDLSLDLADFRNRPPELLDNVFVKVAQDDLTCSHNNTPANYHQQMPQQVAGSTMMYLNTQKWLAAQYVCTNNATQKKKRKDSSKPQAEKRSRSRPMHQMTSFAALNETAMTSNLVGLSLASELRSCVKEDSSAVTSCRSNLNFPISLSDRLSAQITKQQNEIFDLLRIQMEQLRLIIEERTHLHSKAVLSSVGEGLSCMLRAQDVELEQMGRKNLELQQKVNHLSLETQAWQSKAWSYDAMQAKQVALRRACKKCQSNEVSIVLLPCLHLCVCKECRDSIERCPSCHFPISDRVEVYLS
ncbi:hypothetical protein GOP47_0011366 [Adiantum capillus-veneris]|uniref:RING-type domain-containing protein n=1 Tax=Adiantum capillus-veneris TaxID=13818 RepID=A0A9D4UU35_ADICA|nr:hypothetical protein GOP47_0011366 [Adiantum capillus-veneris]